jgi:hypothetical protein
MAFDTTHKGCPSRPWGRQITEAELEPKHLCKKLFRFKIIKQQCCLWSVHSPKTTANRDSWEWQRSGAVSPETHSTLKQHHTAPSVLPTLTTGTLEAIWKGWLGRNSHVFNSLWSLACDLAWPYAPEATYIQQLSPQKSISIASLHFLYFHKHVLI